ncbi:MAG: YkgJ family cysteine cluster protein [Myxococcota bacterium]
MAEPTPPPKPTYAPLEPPHAPKNDHPQSHFEGLRDALRPAFNRVHADLARTQQVELEQAAIVQAMLQILMAKGIVTGPELDMLYPQMHHTLAVARAQQSLGPKLSPAGLDPREPTDLDCASHHATCGAACCSSFNVFLTPEEASSGRYVWDFTTPYRLLVDGDGTCVYFDRERLGCSIWHDRPTSCRTFDCRDDGRVWDDYPARRLSLQSMEAKARLAAARARAAGSAP